MNQVEIYSWLKWPLFGWHEKVKTFEYLGPLLTNQISIHEKIKCGLRAENSSYFSVQTLFFYSSSLNEFEN